MKRLLLLLVIIGFVTFTGCEKHDMEDITLPLEQRFDFSGIDYKNLNITAIYDGDRDGENQRNFRFPNTTIIKGQLFNCTWIGIFENKTGRRLFEYLDNEQPFVGAERLGEIYGVYFNNEMCALIMQYPNNAPSSYWLDLITIEEDRILRSVIDENALCAPVSDGVFNRLTQWTDGILCSYYVGTLILYDIAKEKFICKTAEFNSPYSSDAESLFFSAQENSEITNLFISANNPFHCFHIGIADGNSVIREYQLEYDKCSLSNERKIELFNNTQASYTLEYKVKTKERILAVVTQTIIISGKIIKTRKSLDVRLENDKLKVEVQ